MKMIVAVLASTMLAGAAFAQMMNSPASPSSSADASGPAPQMSDHMSDHMSGNMSGNMSGAKHAGGVEKHIQDLHAKLMITPAEEAQWDEVAKTMRENAKDMDLQIDKRDASVGSATAPDNLNSYADIAQAHANSVKKLATAFSGLYSSMSDEQKKVADEVFSHRRHEGHKIASR